MNDGLAFAQPNEEIVRFDISMDEGFGVDVFETAEELISEHEDCFELEAAAAVVEEVFEGWTEEVEDHYVVVAFDAVPADIGDAHCDILHFRLMGVCLCMCMWDISFDVIGFEVQRRKDKRERMH